MPNTLIFIFVIASLVIVFSPIYLQRQKLWLMADEDLKKIDYEDWKTQQKSNAYIKLGSRIIWGLVILSGFFLNFRKIIEQGFNWLTIFVAFLGISFIIWGILSFRREIKKVNEIE